MCCSRSDYRRRPPLPVHRAEGRRDRQRGGAIIGELPSASVTDSAERSSTSTSTTSRGRRSCWAAIVVASPSVSALSRCVRRGKPRGFAGAPGPRRVTGRFGTEPASAVVSISAVHKVFSDRDRGDRPGGIDLDTRAAHSSRSSGIGLRKVHPCAPHRRPHADDIRDITVNGKTAHQRDSLATTGSFSRHRCCSTGHVERNVELPLDSNGYPGRTASVGRPRCSRSWSWVASSVTTLGSCRVGCSSGSPSPAPSASSPLSSSWTNRSARR